MGLMITSPNLFTLRILLRSIEAIIRRLQTNIEAELSFRKITLFPASYNVLISGNAIILTLTERRLMERLGVAAHLHGTRDHVTVQIVFPKTS
ncbi:hypothetical protein [Exiguobacterium artemiae]